MKGAVSGIHVKVGQVPVLKATKSYHTGKEMFIKYMSIAVKGINVINFAFILILLK